jgi:putative metalloprotease
MYRFSAWRTNRELGRNSTELTDPPLVNLIGKIAVALDLSEVRVFIYEIKTVNGLAAPDGRVFITRGFYEKYRNGDVTAAELASVIAHELGHVSLGHSRRRMIDFSGQNALKPVLVLVLNRFLPGAGPVLAGLATTLLAARLSRRDEYEADAFAATILDKTGIGVGAQKSMFEKLAGMMNSGAAGKPAWLLSHPETRARIKAIEKLEKSWARIGAKN